jgi:uncharacterized protein YcbX
MFIAQLTLFPIKSCAGVAVDRARVGRRGLEAKGVGDRRWMLSDADGRMITQRQVPDLARVRVELLEGALRVSGDDLEPIIVDPSETLDQRSGVILHGREVAGHRCPAAADDWFSRFLGQPVTLLHQRDEDLRLCDPDFALAPGEDRVGFADAYPYLVAAEATLARVNGLLAEPVPMNRFRPNIVIGGAEADAEYGWKRLSLGEAELTIVKPCTRCVMTTIDQARGVKTGKEPLAALGRAYFLSARFGAASLQGAIFGENAIPSGLGAVRPGDAVAVLEHKTPHAFRNPNSVLPGMTLS